MTAPSNLPADEPAIRRNVDLDISVDELWQLVSDADHLAEWLGDTVDLDLQPGGAGAVVEDGVLRFVHVDRVDVGRRLSFSWWQPDAPEQATQVVFEVGAGRDGGSRLVITETLNSGTLHSSAMNCRATACTGITGDAHDLATRQRRWEARVCALWACTVVAALIA